MRKEVPTITRKDMHHDTVLAPRQFMLQKEMCAEMAAYSAAAYWPLLQEITFPQKFPKLGHDDNEGH
jgi:hypothetical protein